MSSSPRDAYLETQVLTATPQRLRLMLIEGAIRRLRAAQAAWQAGNLPEGIEAVGHCRDIVTELIAGIRPEQTPAAKQILGVYMFIYSTLVEAQLTRDETRLRDVIRVLDEERITWQTVCEQMPEAPIAARPKEELAPQRVADHAVGYGPPSPISRDTSRPAFCIEA
jgi:flagellar protein FliS